ncbi:MAG TPA: T9SS type B sorting domain-containing protein [Ohtaekwangia sp.]|nr:T9SS type B sorting domain-containing protein [Ohtaekwangia sp.]
MNGRLFILLIATCILPSRVLAQYPSNNGKFMVDEKEGCAPFTLTLDHNLCDGVTSCTALYGNGRSKLVVDGDTLQYMNAGTFDLQIVVGVTGTDNDNLQITVRPNIKPAFEAYACNGSRVAVRVTDTNFDNYVFSYDDGMVLTKDASITKNDEHLFAAPPPPPVNRVVSVRGRNDNAADNCFDSARTVLVTPTLPAATLQQVTALQTGTEVQLDQAITPDVQYRVMVSRNSPGAFQNFTLTSDATVILPNLRPDDEYYCFRLDPFDPCTNTTTAAVSNVVCSANSDVAAQDDQNALKWVTSAVGASGYTVMKDGAALPPVIPANQFAYTDTDVICNTPYRYQLITNYPGGATSVSMEKTVTAISTTIPAPVENISSIVNQQSVQLEWTQDPLFTAAEYTIVKAVDGNYAPLATSTQQTFTDNDYNTNVQTCYRISYIDNCGNQSPPSADACPVRLTGSLQNDNSIMLAWSNYEGWKNGVDEYQVDKYDMEGNLLQSFNVNGNTLTDSGEDFINQSYIYIITAIPTQAGVVVSVSNAIAITKEPQLYYPTAFTPNKDGLNDTFQVFGQFIAKFEMKIFNRWGELMFITDDLGGQGWDGTYKGDLMPESTYVFTARIVDLAGRTFDRSGTVLLLKKK